MKKLFKFLLMLIPVIALTVFVSCGGDDPDPEEECTFAEDPDCFCDENPNDAQCVDTCTFAEDPDCFCEANPEDSQCVDCTFEGNPDCFCEANPDDEACEEIAFQEDPIAFCFANPDSEFCVSVLINGDFEDATVVRGVHAAAENPGNYGAAWWMANPNDRARYTIIDASTEEAQGANAVKVEILTEQPNHYQIQIVNTQTEVTAGKRYIMLAMIKPDEAGRRIYIAGGTDGGLAEYNYWDFAGTNEEVILESGWNQVGIYIQAPLFTSLNENDQVTYADYDPLTVTHVRAQINMSFPEINPPGEASFIIDDVKVIEVGDWLDPEADLGLFCNLYGSHGDVVCE